MSFTKFKALFDSSSNGRLLIHKGIIIECNIKAPEILQIPFDSLYEQNFAHALSKTQAYNEFAEANLFTKLQHALDGERQVLSWFYLTDDQRTLNLEISINKISVDGSDYAEVRITDNTHRYQLQQAINYIASEAASDKDNSFFENMLKKLSELFSINYSLIGLYEDEACSSIETFSLCAQGKIINNTTFVLKGAAGNNIITKGICSYSKDVQKIFPDIQLFIDFNIESFISIPLFNSQNIPMGFLAALDTKQMENIDHFKEIMQIYALRTANELEHLDSSLQLTLAKNIAEQAYHAKTEFLSNMSHELRTPLHAILSYSQFGITKKNLTAEKISKYFHAINKSGTRLLHLVNNLLDLGKMDAGKIELSLSTQDIVTITSESISELKSLLEAKNIHLKFNSTLANNTLLCDKALIHQLLINITANAIKFSAENTTINVSIQDNKPDSHANDSIYITVSDNGVGIPEKELESIFDEFIQSSNTKTGAGGTGLGLAISKKIVNAHHGQIWATNRIKNDGAIFHILLPKDIDSKTDTPQS